MKPACVQLLYPHGTGAVERLGTFIGKKTSLSRFFAEARLLPMGR